jgi:hypothetical protein
MRDPTAGSLGQVACWRLRAIARFGDDVEPVHLALKGDVDTHCLVPWPIREVCDNLGKVLVPPRA